MKICEKCGATMRAQGENYYVCDYCGATSVEKPVQNNSTGNTGTASEAKSKFATYVLDYSDEKLARIVNNPQSYETGFVEAAKDEIIARSNFNHTRPQLIQQEIVYKEDEKLGCWMGGLCFIIPLVGLILFFVYNSRDEDSKAKSAITAAIIGFAVGFVMGILGSL